MSLLTGIYSTDKIVLVHYPRDAGGKFLIACLGLSSNAVLQDSRLAEFQLRGKLSPAQKAKMLVNRLKSVTECWYDFTLGCNRYWFHESIDYAWGKPPRGNFNKTVTSVINHNWLAFLISHNSKTLMNCVSCWPNAKVILFENCDKFISIKRNNKKSIRELNGFWKFVHEQDPTNIPAMPPTTIAMLEKLPKTVLDAISSSKNRGIRNYFQLYEKVEKFDYAAAVSNIKQQLVTPPFIWDSDWFLDKELTFTKLAKLAQDLNLDLDLQYVDEFYDEYMKALERVKQHENYNI